MVKTAPERVLRGAPNQLRHRAGHWPASPGPGPV